MYWHNETIPISYSTVDYPYLTVFLHKLYTICKRLSKIPLTFNYNTRTINQCLDYSPKHVRKQLVVGTVPSKIFLYNPHILPVKFRILYKISLTVCKCLHGNQAMLLITSKNLLLYLNLHAVYVQPFVLID